MLSHPAETYRSAESRSTAETVDLQRRMGVVETGRMATFLLAAIVGLLRNDLPIGPTLPTAVALLAAVGFAVLVVRHRALKAELRRATAAQALARMGSRRLKRDWAGLAEIRRSVEYDDPLLEPISAEAEAHAYLLDLDLFGPASIRALLGPTPTPTGTSILGAWLSGPADVAEIVRRQGAVEALARDPEGRADLAIEGLLVDRVDRTTWMRFLEWTRRPPLFGTDEAGLPEWALPLARFLPPVTWALIAAWFVGLIPGWTWFLPLAIQTALAWRWGNALNPYFEQVSGRSPGIRGHHALLAAWEKYTTGSDEVGEIQGRLTNGQGGRASDSIRILERWLDAAESRASMLHPLLSAGVLWDVHVAWGLERWRRVAGAHVESWFEAVGELEALSALATLAHDEPTWSFPSVDTGTPGFEAEELGHPLLSDEERRTSDVTLDAPGRFLLVTGSNMSGKSTLLRSIGLAAVLAQAGSVVCAKQARLSRLRVFTSMRIHDSLTEGVSLFMAELLRLKALVDASDVEPGEPALLYLIDEVLQGTNSEERRVAARRIVRHLLDSNAIGAVTTHDLALHDDPALDPNSTKVHFREHVDDSGGRVLTFDYVLRPGLATSRNALKLLRIVGLDEKDGSGGTG
jgi:energy-coupling factor transporter ATP-binding protein EcfA2